MTRGWGALILASAVIASGCSARQGAAGQGPEASDGSISTLVSEGASASPPSPSLAATAEPSIDLSPTPGASRSPADPSPRLSPSPVASPSPGDPNATTTPKSQPTPAPRPTPTRRRIHRSRFRSRTGWTEPRSGSRRAGRSTSAWTCSTKELDQRQCTIVHSIMPDLPKIPASQKALPPIDVQTVALIDGRHDFRASRPSIAGTLTAETWMVAADGAPERCAGLEFSADPVSISTLDELTNGMAGSWHGCATTPWVPEYWVDLTFRADGTYSSSVGEVLDSFPLPDDHGTDADDPDKRWRIDDLQASGLGVGIIDIAFGGRICESRRRFGGFG